MLLRALAIDYVHLRSRSLRHSHVPSFILPVNHPTETAGVAAPVGEAAVLPFLRLFLLWLAGIDLRLTLLAVPPVVPLIHRDLSLDEKAIGILTGMPTLLLGIAAVGGSLMIARIGARRAMILGLLLVAAAGAVRGLGPSVPMLFGMTFLMAAGIAVSQPAAPTIVGEWFPASIGFATAVYVNGLLVGEAIGAALTLPVVLPLAGGSWGGALAAWSIVVALTAAAILHVHPARSTGRGTARPLASQLVRSENLAAPDFCRAGSRSCILRPTRIFPTTCTRSESRGS